MTLERHKIWTCQLSILIRWSQRDKKKQNTYKNTTWNTHWEIPYREWSFWYQIWSYSLGSATKRHQHWCTTQTCCKLNSNNCSRKGKKTTLAKSSEITEIYWPPKDYLNIFTFSVQKHRCYMPQFTFIKKKSADPK